ncbi:MAG: glycosyltransferase family 2 protein [Candidatus Zambryskibacteria bacterium]|nr:glycosyltransferase family 2 protein [Candidatus Zambryskibacteria bacterium]
MPKISVILPVLNGEKYLSEAIRSILDQTLADFELIIINDGSMDKTEEIIKSFKDPRIVYINNSKNLGLAASYNKGIEVARGKYIARMDADDVSLPERFAEQFLFLERKPYIGIVGSSIIIMNESGRRVAVHNRSESHLGIKFSSLFSTPMYHPTVMGRKEIFKSHHFNETFSNSEDYELWSRLLFETDVKFANIRKPLLKYRIYPQSFTQTLNLDRRALSAHNTIKNVGHYINLSQSEKDFIIHLRQEKMLSPFEFIVGIILYCQAAIAFIKKEHPGMTETIGIWSKYFKFIITLTKFEIRKVLKI